MRLNYSKALNEGNLEQAMFINMKYRHNPPIDQAFYDVIRKAILLCAKGDNDCYLKMPNNNSYSAEEIVEMSDSESIVEAMTGEIFIAEEFLAEEYDAQYEIPLDTMTMLML